MKATELMIGDWIKTPIDIENGAYVYDIDRISSINEYDEFSTSEFDMCGDVADLQPIPLTKKILKENGFREDENGNYEYWGDEDDNLWIQVQFDKNKETPICYNIQTPHNGRLFEMADNVHELQHALKLCGIEKQIVL